MATLSPSAMTNLRAVGEIPAALRFVNGSNESLRPLLKGTPEGVRALCEPPGQELPPGTAPV